MSFPLPFFQKLQSPVVAAVTIIQRVQKFRIMTKCSHIKRSALSRFLLAVTHISGKDHHILPISLLHGMDQGNRICNAAIQIRNTVNLYHGTYNGNTGRSPSNIHQATSVMLLGHIFRITSLAVGHYHLTLRI